MVGSKDDRAYNSGNADRRIRKVLDRLGEALTDDLGFENRRNSGDKYRLTSISDDGVVVKITARPSYTHGEGRVCFEIFNDGNRVAASEVRISGSVAVHDETEICRRKIVLLVRRAGVPVIEQERTA